MTSSEIPLRQASVPEIIPERVKDSAHSGWDPTDDSPENPYNK